MGGLAVAALVAYRVQSTQLQDPLLVAVAVAMVGLGALPAIIWAQASEKQLPAFEVMMLTTIPFYAFPLFDQKAAAVQFPDHVVWRAAIVVIAYQAANLLAYFALPGHPGRSPLWRESLLPDAYLRHTRIGLALTTVYQFTSLYTNVIPPELNSVFRALLYGIGMLSAFIQMQRWGTGLLSPAEKAFVAGNIVLQIIMHVAGLYLISGASLLLLVLISYTSASRRLPLLASVAGIAFFGLLHNGKGPMRAIYWQPDSPRVGPAELPAYFSQWIGFSLAQRAQTDEGVATRLLERTSLFHVLCIVIDCVPTRQPYLDGETYASIPAQFVPRILWSDKPAGHVSNTRLAVYLGFVPDEETAGKVSIAFGTPAEAYTNFGFIGALLLGVFFGLVFRKLTTLTAHSPSLSIGGLSMVLLLAWSLQAEMTLSVWLTSLYQAAVTLIGVPVAFKVLFGRRT